MNKIRPYSEAEKLRESYQMLQSAHAIYGVQCQNCIYYNGNKDCDEYKGQCELNNHSTYWSQYCDDFEVGE